MQGSGSVTSGGNLLVDMLANYKTEKGINDVEGTIAAFIGQVTWLPGAVVTSPTFIRGGCGILVEGNATVGQAPVPGIDSYPWMWLWQPHWYPEVQEESAGVFEPKSVVVDVHVRAMRKIKMNERLNFKAHNFAAATATVGITGNILILR